MGGRPGLEVPWDLAMQRALDVSFSLSSSFPSWDRALALLARVFPLDDWWAAFDAIADRSVVKALLDPRPGHENGAAP
jgi:hypothetical protein